MRIWIQNNPLYYSFIKYTLSLFAANKKIALSFVDDIFIADLIIDETGNSDLPLAIEFYRGLQRKEFHHSFYFKKDCMVFAGNSEPDLVATCFYMLTSIQEYHSNDSDEIGRFKYTASYQHKFNTARENLVQQYFDRLAQHPKFSRLPAKREHSSVFISHDIDNVHTAWLEDGFAALKKGQVHHLFRLLFNAVFQRPDWLNMDKIMALHDEYSLKSTFFWLASKGRINKRMVNADYDVQDKKIQLAISSVRKNGFENGIHKSISGESFESESARLGFTPVANRYHYLRFKLPDAYRELEKAGIKLDASLGFAESYGFRNSYGQAFQPFDLGKRKAYDLVEIPLHIMDRTFYNYMNTPAEQVADLVIDFLEAHKYNCTLSILWHNNFFTSIKYKGYLAAYKKIIAYLYDADFKSLNQQEIIDKYLVFSA